MTLTMFGTMGISQNDVLRVRTRRMLAAWRQLGAETRAFDLVPPGGIGDFQTAARAENAAHAGGAPDNPDNDELLIYAPQGWAHETAAGCGRHILDLADHPAHHLVRIAKAQPGSLLVVGGTRAADFIGRHVRSDLKTIILPPAADPPAVPPVETGRRDIGVLFAGAVGPPADVMDMLNGNPALMRIASDIAAMVTEEPTFDVMECLVSRTRVGTSTIRLDFKNRVALAMLIDRFVRSKLRDDLLAAVARRTPLTIVGPECRAVFQHKDTLPVEFLKPVAYGDLGALYGRARVVLNIFPAYYDFHDRIVDGMAAGAAVMTPRNDFMAREFRFDAELAELPTTPRAAAEAVARLSEDTETTQRLAAEGHRAFLDRYTWRRRAERMLQALDIAVPLHRAEPPHNSQAETRAETETARAALPA